MPLLVGVAALATVLVRASHGGIAGDYLLWLVLGTAVIGRVCAFTLR